MPLPLAVPSPLRLVPPILLALALSGCTIRGSGPAFEGEVPLKEQFVGEVSLPEVSPSGDSRPYLTRARPRGLLLVFFGFVSCPDICPTTLSDVKRALGRIGPSARDVEVAFITVDPVRDSARVMTDYLGSFFESGAHALRPSTQAELGRAQTAFQATSTITRQSDGHVDVSHTATIYVVDSAGRVRVTWPFGTTPDEMAHDLRLLIAEASRAPEALPGTALEVTDPWIRASPGGVTLGAAYVTLRSGSGDRLQGVSVDDSVAASVEMHEVLADSGGALRMQRVEAVELPAGEAVEFRPGGRHLMLIDLRQPLRPGMLVELRLQLERAGEQSVRAEVRGN